MQDDGPSLPRRESSAGLDPLAKAVDSTFDSDRKKKGDFVGLEQIAVKTGPPAPDLIDDAEKANDGTLSNIKRHHPIGPDLIDDTEPMSPMLEKDVAVCSIDLQFGALDDSDSPPAQNQFHTNQDYLEDKKHDKDYFTTLTSQVEKPSSRDASHVEHEVGVVHLERSCVQNIELPNTATSPDSSQAIIAATNGDSDDDNKSIPIIPEAYLVNEEEVTADPLLPWYKHRRTAALFSVICLLVVAAAIAAGIRPQPDTIAELVVIPTTLAPSASMAPSQAPTTCGFKVSSNVKKLDILHSDPYIPLVVVDGQNALVTAHGPESNSAFNVVFFSLSDSGDWERGSVFIEENFDQYYAGGTYSAAMSGRTALVGLYKTNTDAGVNAGVVHVYQQDKDLGVWNKVDELRPKDGGTEGSWFGRSVDIDGDLACVAASLEFAIYIFERDEGRWIQSLMVPFDLGDAPWECLIADKTVVIQLYDVVNDIFKDILIYNFDPETKEVAALQDPLRANGFRVLSENFLVFSTASNDSSGETVYDGVYIYRRQDVSDPFTLHQFLNSSEKYDKMFGARLAIDQSQDLLLVYAYNTTVFFSQQNGSFEEALVLNMPYLSYQVSNRNVLTTQIDMTLAQEEATPTFRWEIESFSVADCIQPATGVPYLSLTPTVTTVPLPCNIVDIEVVFDSSPGDTAWDITRLNSTKWGENVVAESYHGNSTDFRMRRSWHVCLPDGEYQFTIHDNEGNGLCCGLGSEGNYTLRIGTIVIAQGGEFSFNETVSFILPFGQSPSETPSLSCGPSAVQSMIPSDAPSLSHAPSSSLSPSSSPTISLNPTKFCYWLNVSIVADLYPMETSWTLYKQSMIAANESEKNVIFDNSPSIEFKVNGVEYNASHIGNSSTDATAIGRLCSCGLGNTVCECQYQICFIERGNNTFYEKVTNCELGGGLGAIIFDNGGDMSSAWTLAPESASIPAVIISQEDGQFHLTNSLGQFAWISVAPQQIPLETGILKWHQLCLKEGQYQFIIFDSGGDGICCYYGDGGYTLTLDGNEIAQGGAFGSNETTTFDVPML